jgi:hypothetical protein
MGFKYPGWSSPGVDWVFTELSGTAASSWNGGSKLVERRVPGQELSGSGRKALHLPAQGAG